MPNIDFDLWLSQQLAVPHDHAQEACAASASFPSGEAPGQTPLLDQPATPPGGLVPYGHVHARPAPPAVPGESCSLADELSKIFSNLAFWLSAAQQADNDSSDSQRHQEGDGGPRPVAEGRPQPERLEALSEGLLA